MIAVSQCPSPFSLPSPRPQTIGFLAIGPVHILPSCPTFHTVASILRCSWPMVWPVLAGPWNSLQWGSHNPNFLCRLQTHTQTLGPALMQSGNKTKHTNPSLKHASNILINPSSLPYMEETLLGWLLLYFQDEAASRPQKCSLDSL